MAEKSGIGMILRCQFLTQASLRQKKRGPRESISDKMSFPWNPMYVEGEHGHLFSKPLEMRACQVEDILLEDAVERSMICVNSEIGQSSKIK